MSDDEPVSVSPRRHVPPKPPLPVPRVPGAPLPPGWAVARVTPPAHLRHSVRLGKRSPSARLLRDPRAWLVAYVVVLAGVAFWPTPVDAGAGTLPRAITRAFPTLTYHRIEWGSNVLLFVPLGWLLAMCLARRRHLVLPIALIATVTIEGVQGHLSVQQSPSPGLKV